MQVESEESSADSLSVFVSDKSIPLTFTNDKTFPWTIGEGYLQMVILETQTALLHCHFHTIATNVQS